MTKKGYDSSDEYRIPDRGLTCVGTFDYDVADRIFEPYDNPVLSVILRRDDCRKKSLPRNGSQVYWNVIHYNMLLTRKPGFTFWSSLLCTIVVRTILSFILALWMWLGIVGIAVAMVLDWSLKAVLDIVRFRSDKWKGYQLI